MKWRYAFCIVSFGLWLPAGVSASGLSTTFANVLVTSIPVGTDQTIGGPEGRGLVLKNLESTPVMVRIQALAPSQSQLKPGHEAIPDPTWIVLEPSTMTIAAKQASSVRIRLRVPPDAQYRNKTYQVMLWSRAVSQPQQGMSYNAALLSTLRFQTLP